MTNSNAGHDSFIHGTCLARSDHDAEIAHTRIFKLLHRVVLQRVAACCNVLQRITACGSVLQSFQVTPSEFSGYPRKCVQHFDMA
eukprot:CAMPEP_0179472996 /NCGR_PEP_ID=MMETSP0799-20121207/52854_1 /TAXON_ID=46947 /ORGANISM="Geminigera cryophila, Strain CCMP2564" /LENGTH=84 /DNA_ID=CAMNT_0021281421 /DNA_START=148 /DNA_END=398 /DNA_ORIENTATION=+